MVTYIEYGDIFALKNIQGYAHGCNCAGSMGAGIAVQFKNRWHDMFVEYKKRCESRSLRPGGVFVWKAPDAYIFNLGTQEHWRTGARLSYIRKSLEKMIEYAEEKDIKTIAMPAIGAGLGGLKWDVIKDVIDEACMDSDVVVYVIVNYRKS